MIPESKTTEAARREQPDTAGKLRTRAPDGSATRHPFVRREPWTADARDCGSGPRCRLATSGSPGTGRSARPRHGARAAPPPCEASTCSTSSGSISCTPTLAPLISLSASHAPQSRRCMGASSRRRRRAGRARTLERGPRAMLRHWAASLTPPSSARRTRVFLLHRIDAVGYVCNMNELHRVCIQRARSAAVTTAAPAHRTPARFNLAESVIWEHPPRQSQDAPTITGRVPPGASGPCPACRRVIFCATGALLEAPER